MAESIFVSIAAYRDSELPPTLDDMFEKAKNPDDLHVCICWQYDPDNGEREWLDKYKTNPNIDIIYVKKTDSLGCCWARSEIGKRYNGETFYLQLDSHHRFVQDWDQLCKDMWFELKGKGVNKPLLTSYVPSYDPYNDPGGRAKEPWRLDFDRVTPEGVTFMLPAAMTEEELKAPLPSRFFSAHFVFTQGSFIQEVPYDPLYYFHGEEISYAVRSFTHGYDMFNPNKIMIYHYYERKNRTRIWDEDPKWVNQNNACHLRNRKLLEMDGEKRDIDFGIYGLGKERTQRDYEEFSGIQFSTRGIQRWTLDHKPPPNPQHHASEEDYQNSFEYVYRHCIDVWKGSVPERDYDFWAVIFKDGNGEDMYRQDADPAEIAQILSKEGDWGNVWRNFHRPKDKLPKQWIIWPHSISKGWCDMLQGSL